MAKRKKTPAMIAANERRMTIPPEIQGVLAVQVAELILAGKTILGIGKELNLDRKQVRKMINHPKADEFFKEVESTAKKSAIAHIRRATSDMSIKIMETLNNLLEKDSPEGLKIALKVIGALDPEEGGNNNQAINVIMPGKREKVIEVKDKK